MIVWRGIGILVFVFLFLPPALLMWRMRLWPNQRLFPWQEAMVFTIGWLIGGAVCSILGQRLNRDAKQTGVLHDLYFIRVEYWGLMLWALAALALVGLPFGMYDVPKNH